MKVLLVSEDAVKTDSNISENVWGEYLRPAIVDAQERHLQPTIGTCLYERLCNLVKDGTISDSGNTAYKTLLDGPVRDFLVWTAVSELVPVLGVKLANLGTLVSNDEHVQNLSEGERERIRLHYEYKSDFYLLKLQRFLNKYRANYPELESGCNCLFAPNLKSSASQGLWLGGLRGRIIRGKDCCHDNI